VSGPERTPVERAKVDLTPVDKREKGSSRMRSSDVEVKSVETDAAVASTIEDLAAREFTLRASLSAIFAVEHPSRSERRNKTWRSCCLHSVARRKAHRTGEGSFDGLRVLTVPVGKEQDGKLAFPERVLLRQGRRVRRDRERRHVPRGPVARRRSERELAPTNHSQAERSQWWSGSDGGAIELGRVTLAPNVDTHGEFDVRHRSGEVRAARRGERRAGSGPRSSVGGRSRRSRERSSCSTFRAQEWSRSFPGTYRFNVYPEESSLSFVANFERTLQAGESARVDIDARSHRRDRARHR
jgi:hypothetical protein